MMRGMNPAGTPVGIRKNAVVGRIEHCRPGVIVVLEDGDDEEISE
jgi:hypothetical protein